jgi:hypothetical protein
MPEPERIFWRVTYVTGNGERIYADRIGPYTKAEVEQWAITEIDATTRPLLNFDPLEPAE